MANSTPKKKAVEDEDENKNGSEILRNLEITAEDRRRLNTSASNSSTFNLSDNDEKDDPPLVKKAKYDEKVFMCNFKNCENKTLMTKSNYTDHLITHYKRMYLTVY